MIDLGGPVRLRLQSTGQIRLAARLLQALTGGPHAEFPRASQSVPGHRAVRFADEFQRPVGRGARTVGRRSRSGALFVFGNRRHNRIKILYFDGTGVCVLAKRLEEGHLSLAAKRGPAGAKIRLAPQALQLLLDGVDLKDGARRAWYESAA